MPVNVPDNPKVYTTTYDNFRGVDFTNDATNVWHRRSPTGVNMLPDAAGRPFKRHGWEILVSNKEICEYLEVESCAIYKCAWFELGGKDHVVIFTDVGVAFYNGEFTAKNMDYECYSGFDRSFFFEGNGLSAFYIYGGYRVWRYETDENSACGYALNDVTDKLTIPRILIGTSADGAGTAYEGYNLLNNMVSVEYNDTTLFTYWCSDGLQIGVKSSFVKSLGTVYKWVYENGDWTKVSGGTEREDACEVYGTPEDGDEIIIIYTNGVLLTNNVSDNLTVWKSETTQFDTQLAVIGEADTLNVGECRLHIDNTAHRKNKRAWLEFSPSEVWHENDFAGMDYLKVIYPSVTVNVTPYPKSGEEQYCSFSDTATLVEG